MSKVSSGDRVKHSIVRVTLIAEDAEDDKEFLFNQHIRYAGEDCLLFA